jgi:hypothetical protein
MHAHPHQDSCPDKEKKRDASATHER